MPTTPSPTPAPRRPVRGIAIASITALIGAGMVVIPASVAPAAAAIGEHETFLVSQADGGISSEASITPDGQHVAFTSTASNLFGGDTNGVSDVFLASAHSGDPFSGDPVLISAPDASLDQVPANGKSSHPVASADGRYVAFLSAATNLTADDYAPAGWTNVYVRDTLRGTTIRIDGQYGEPLGNATSVDMSDDGRYIAFVSAAANFLPVDPISGVPLDNNNALDGFIADLDANGDGTRGDLIVTNATGFPPPRGVTELAISGSGARIAFTAHHALNPGEPEDRDDYLYVGARDNTGDGFVLVAKDGHSLAISSNGDVVTYISDSDCGAPTVIAATFGQGQFPGDPERIYYVGVGTRLVEASVGYVAHPVVSADGSTVAWETTRPIIDLANLEAPRIVLPQPVVRMQRIVWRDATAGLTCESLNAGREEIAVGQSPSLSASGRTVAFSGPSALSPAPAAVLAVDTHSHEGLSVASTQGELSHIGYMTAVDVTGIPVSEIRGYASALANAPIHRIPIHRIPIHRIPIHRIPIHRIPIHRIPIHRIPIHRIPIHRIDIPGGWTELLVGTPFENQAPQTVIFGEVLEWAEANAPGNPAAERIQTLTLGDVALDNSGIDALTLASLVLGNAKLSQVHIEGTGTDTQRWQDVVDVQSLVDDLGAPVTVSADTVLAELDFAGLDVSRTGVEAVGLASLPISDTLLDTMPATSLILENSPIGHLLVSELSDTAETALFGGPRDGTIAQNAAALTGEATAADLARGVPSTVTLGDLLFSVVDRASFPWEQIDPAAIDPAAAAREAPSHGCDGQKRCGRSALYTFTFDRGPGDSAPFLAPTASISLPAGTVPVDEILASASGASTSLYRAEYSGPVQIDGNLVRLPLADAVGGTSISFEVGYSTTTQPGASSATGTLSSGGLTASLRMLAYFDPDFLDDPANNRVGTDWQDGELDRESLQEGRVYYEWLSAGPSTFDDTEARAIPGPALDEDYFLVDAPAPGKRLIISTNATDGQIALALFASSSGQTQLGEAASAPVPGTAVTEQNGDAWAPAESGADAAAPLAEHALVDQAAVGGGGSAQLEAASTDVSPDAQMLLRVTSGDGTPSSALYSLRAQYVDEPAEQACPAAARPLPDARAPHGVSDEIDSDTNTIYLIDSQRFDDTYGAGTADTLRAALHQMDGKGVVGMGTVQGAVLSVDESLDVRGARDALLDDNPCSMKARADLTHQISVFVDQRIQDVRSKITSVVIIGGDDMIPLAPVAQHTSQFNEASHAADLRRSTTAAGGLCPDDVTAGDVDPCATPLSAAAATNHILTDDPYGLANAYESLGGHLYVPTVGVGRLVDTPDQILATIAQFVAAGGILKADSSLTGGYGAWAELPGIVTDTLNWRTLSEARLEDPDPDTDEWDKSDVEAALFPAGGQSPKVVSINTHADETRLLPGLDGADEGRFGEDDLLHAADYVASPQLAGSLVFMIGCHAGGNLPTAYYGDVADWADVFSSAGGFVGNTGYGLANNVSTALGERLMALYADWIGVVADGKPVSAAGALTFAKQSYLGGLGLYSGYDEKVLMEAVYYGLPMYTFANELKPAPLPEIPKLVPVAAPAADLVAAGFTLNPRFEQKQATDDQGREVAYLAAASSSAPTALLQDPLAIPGQPILPRVVSRLVMEDIPDGMVPRGALITGLTSDVVTEIDNPATAQASIGVAEPAPSRTNVAFPSTFATVTQQLTPSGPIDLLVVTPARVEAAAPGSGVVEQFTTMDLQVVYADSSNTDTTAPLIRSVDAPRAGWSNFTVYADDSESEIARMLLLVQRAEGSAWEPHWMTGGGSSWRADIGSSGTVRWIVQAVDTAGNVAIDTGRGHLPAAGSPAPSLGDAGGSAALNVGDRLVRSIDVTGVSPGEHLTASFQVTQAGDRPGREQTVASGPVLVTTGVDGVSRAALDHVANMSGTFTVKVEVCRARSCTTTAFPLEVGLVNTAPAASVDLSSSTAGNWTTSTLTATADGADPDGDDVTLSYAWTRNGVALANAGPDPAVLALTGIAVAGDVIAVTVTPSDGKVDGHAASDSVLIEVAPLEPPRITASATNGGGVYAEGTWSRSPVTVSFDCTGGVPPISCPEQQIVSDDTDGIVIEGEMRGGDGAVVATAQFAVKVDGTAPKLGPVVTPSPVVQNAPAVAAANATDIVSDTVAGSGVLAQSVSCTPATLDTSKVGTFPVSCTATDNAGNTAAAVSVTYTVVAPTPVTPKCRGFLDRTALAPVNADGSSVFLRSSGVPVIFAACDSNGNPISTKKFVTKVTLVSTATLTTRTINELWYPPIQPFSYVKALGVWSGHIPTAKLAGGKKYTYRVDLADGTHFTVTFGVR